MTSIVAFIGLYAGVVIWATRAGNNYLAASLARGRSIPQPGNVVPRIYFYGRMFDGRNTMSIPLPDPDPELESMRAEARHRLRVFPLVVLVCLPLALFIGRVAPLLG